MSKTMSHRPLALLSWVAVATMAAACGSDSSSAAPSTSAAPTTSRTTTATSSPTRTPGALADKWDARVAAAKVSAVEAPCSPAQAQTAVCANWLTAQVEAVLSLSTSLRSDANSAKYSKTIAAAEKVFDASESYAKAGCASGKGTADDCWSYAFAISTNVLTVGLTLRADDMS